MSNISLEEMLRRKTLPEKPLQIEILRQVAAQIDQAHQRNLTHGNLSPQSILVSEPDANGAIAVFVKDFGTTFEIDPAGMGGAPPPQAFYLSPEQVLGIDLGPASDEFSFAVIAYEMIGGGLPFSAAKLSGLIFAICSDPPQPIYEFDPSLSAAVQNVFNRALAKDREGRYASCWTFVAALAAELGRSQPWQPVQPVTEAMPIAAAAAVTAGPPASLPEPPIPEPPSYIPPPAATPSPTWKATPVFEASAAPPRSDFDLPSARRRNRYEIEDEPRPSGSPVKKFALIGLILFALAGTAAYFFNGSRTPDLPTQVLDTRNAPVTPPPAAKEPPSTAPATSSPSPQQSAPAPAATQPQPQPQPANPLPDKSAPTVQTAQSQPPPSPAPPKTQERPAPVAHAASPGIAPAGASPGLVDVELLSEPPGANIVVDGNPALACRAPCNISLSGGRHTLSANLAGYTLAQRIFNVPESTSVFVTMPRLTGALVVTSNPGAATILVDGKDYGLTPATLHLPPGQHRVTLMNGSQRHDETVTVVADGIQATGYSFPR
jgi:serine/threonine protein kinase